MSDLLQANYEQLEELAKLWSQLCDTVQTLHNNLKSQAEELCSEHWLGAGSEAFSTEIMSDVLPSMNRAAEAFCLTGEITMEIANDIRETENGCSALFR